ncbi:MAG: hypothetical protein ABI068_09960 [Ktedonobacterales bacterium]
MPEAVPTPAQSVQQLERAEQQRLTNERQPSRFTLASSIDDSIEHDGLLLLNGVGAAT